MDRRAILVVSFGTSFEDTRERTIGAIESAVRERYGGWEVRRAFTSRIVIEKLKERDGIVIDRVDEALRRLADDGYEEIVVMPTHVMNGTEYDLVTSVSAGFRDSFRSLRVSKPLLTSEEDYDAVIGAMEAAYMRRVFEGPTNGKAIVFMGHGSEHFANASYCQLQMKLIASGHENVYITTVEGFPSFDDTMMFMSCYKFRKVVLAPFMLVAGDHAVNDMAGDGRDSLKSKFIDAGFEVECLIEGLGEHKEFRDLFLEHLSAAAGE